MGVDVRLLPLIGRDFWAAHEILDLERCSHLWPQIRALPSEPIPQPFSFYQNEGYGPRSEDGYGNPLRYVTAGALVTLADRPSVTDNWKNRAVWAYLAEMPPDWPIIIYWH